MIALCVIAALLAAGVLWLTFRVLRLRRSLEMERQESRRLKKLLTLGSREINAELDHMHRLRHDLRHSLPLIERSAQIPEALSLDLAATLERPIPPGRSWAVTVLARHYERRAEDQGVAADIRLEIDADLGDILPDLCLVLSNLLENALEAGSGPAASPRRAISRLWWATPPPPVCGASTAAISPARRRGASGWAWPPSRRSPASMAAGPNLPPTASSSLPLYFSPAQPRRRSPLPPRKLPVPSERPTGSQCQRA